MVIQFLTGISRSIDDNFIRNKLRTLVRKEGLIIYNNFHYIDYDRNESVSLNDATMIINRVLK